MADAAERGQARAELVIDLDVELVVAVGPFGQRVEVVRQARTRRARQAGQYLLRERGDRARWNHAIGVSLSGERIEDRLAEIPGAHRVGRNRGERRDLRRLAE